VGAEYERLLLAKGGVFAPSAAAVVALVEKLRKERWLPDAPGRAVRTVDNDFGSDAKAKERASTEAVPGKLTAEWLEDPRREELRLVWHVTGDAARYPLTMRPPGGAGYTIEIHRSGEYVYPLAANIEPLPTTCACGDDLGFQWDEDEVVPAFGASGGIFAECDACSRTFDPSKRAAKIANPFGGESTQVMGGAAYRFALKVRCGESFVKDAGNGFERELVALVENEFGRDFHEVAALR
jgi:hypothetical protein